jgi:hypothetical protein
VVEQRPAGVAVGQRQLDGLIRPARLGGEHPSRSARFLVSRKTTSASSASPSISSSSWNSSGCRPGCTLRSPEIFPVGGDADVACAAPA